MGSIWLIKFNDQKEKDVKLGKICKRVERRVILSLSLAVKPQKKSFINARHAIKSTILSEN